MISDLYWIIPTICGVIVLALLAWALCKAAVDHAPEEPESFDLDWQWPEFKAARIPPRFPRHEVRRHAVLVGDLHMPERRVSR